MALIDLHLVDDEGHPLDRCLVEAVIRHEPRIRRKFGRYSDPAAFSTAIEGKVRRVAAREKEKQEQGAPSDADEIGRVTWTALWNLGISFVRKDRIEKQALAKLARESPDCKVDDHSKAIIARLDGQKLLSQLSERDRQICDLESLHWTDKQIAAHLNISPAAVRQARHRRNEKIATLLSSYNSKQ